MDFELLFNETFNGTNLPVVENTPEEKGKFIGKVACIGTKNQDLCKDFTFN